VKPIGVDLPLRRGEQGLFKQTFTTQNAIKSNLTNLLLTNFAERPLNPDFGNNLRRFVFEQDIEATKIRIEETIRDVVSRNFPSLQIERFDFENEPNDNKIAFSLSYSLTNYPNLR
jgi:phage baseplate assembly protein W